MVFLQGLEARMRCTGVDRMNMTLYILPSHVLHLEAGRRSITGRVFKGRGR